MHTDRKTDRHVHRTNQMNTEREREKKMHGGKGKKRQDGKEEEVGSEEGGDVG